MAVCIQGEGSFGLGMKLDKRICAYVNSKMPSCFVMGIFGKSGYVGSLCERLYDGVCLPARCTNDVTLLSGLCGTILRCSPSAFSKGSKTDHALRNCKVSVVVVKPDSLLPEMHEAANVVVGIRGTSLTHCCWVALYG